MVPYNIGSFVTCIYAYIYMWPYIVLIILSQLYFVCMWRGALRWNNFDLTSSKLKESHTASLPCYWGWNWFQGIRRQCWGKLTGGAGCEDRVGGASLQLCSCLQSSFPAHWCLFVAPPSVFLAKLRLSSCLLSSCLLSVVCCQVVCCQVGCCIKSCQPASHTSSRVSSCKTLISIERANKT